MEFPDTGSRRLDGWASGDLNDRLREQAEGERLAQGLIGCSLLGELRLTASCGHPVGSLTSSSSLAIYQVKESQINNQRVRAG